MNVEDLTDEGCGLRPVDIAMIGLSAALYAVVGILTSLGIVSPVVGVVRFWPAVIVPAVFAVLFGPWVGGIGAAVGIFISDMVYPGHGIPLLSLTVGVPANFLGFFLIGYISNKNVGTKEIALGLGIGCVILALLGYLAAEALLQTDVVIIFAGIFIMSYAVMLVAWYRFKEWLSYEVSSIIGLGVGSAWIGLGLWAYSQVLPLPLALQWEMHAPFWASFLWFVWTFSTEIPFLVTVVPPILNACYRAFPSLRPQPEKARGERS